MTPRECLETDWYAEGAKAAQASASVTQFMSFQKACNAHGLNPDRWDYVLGWQSVRPAGPS